MKIRRGFRKIILGINVWQYKIGKINVVIFGPTGIKYLTNQSILTGLSWNEIERIEWKNSGHNHPANIRPAHLRKYIENLL